MSTDEARRRFGVFRLEDSEAAYTPTRRRTDAALQAGIAVLTLAALWLLTSGAAEARWGHVIGLASQPLYMVATWRGRQWGMFIVAVMLVGIWGRGIANNFF